MSPAPDDPVRVSESEESAKRAAAASSVAMGLSDERAEVRTAALAELKALYVLCVGGMCTTRAEVARAALPLAKAALAARDPEVRVTGARAFELFAIDAAAEVVDLAEALGDSVTAVRLAALEALCEAGEGAAPVAGQIAKQLREAATPEERAEAATALGNTGVQAEHLDAILDALIRDVPAVQARAAHALGLALEHDCADLPGLAHDCESRREAVSQALHRLTRAA